MSTPRTIAAYCRVSTEDQHLAGTVKSQVNAITAHCVSRGISPEWYLDDGVSGMLELHERPEGARLVADITAGTVAELIVWDFDRLGRGKDVRLTTNTALWIHDQGVQVTSLNNPVDLTSEAGDLQLSMYAWAGARERRQFLTRTTLGKARAAREGRLPGGPVPYGYMQDASTKRLVPSDRPAGESGLTEAAVVQRVFRLLAEEGMTTSAVAAHLNGLGVPSPYGRHAKARLGQPASNVWHHTSVQRLARRDWYAGAHAYRNRNGETIAITVPPLVSAEQWDAAAAALARNRTDASRNRSREYLLRGLLRCGRCGRRMTGETGGAGRMAGRTFYRCVGRRSRYVAGCDAPSLTAPWLEEAVWALCVAVVADPEAYAVTPTTGEAAPAHADLAEYRESLLRQAREVDGQRQRILDLYARGTITVADVDQQLARIDGEAARVGERLREVDGQLAPVTPTPDMGPILARVREVLAQDEVSEAARRAVVARLVRGVVVTPQGVGRKQTQCWRAVVELVTGASVVVTNGETPTVAQEVCRLLRQHPEGLTALQIARALQIGCPNAHRAALALGDAVQWRPKRTGRPVGPYNPKVFSLCE